MRTLFFAAIAAIAATTSASALTVAFSAVQGAPGTVSVFSQGANLLELDLTLGSLSNATIEVTRDAGDADLVQFNAFIEALNDISSLDIGLTFNAEFTNDPNLIAFTSTNAQLFRRADRVFVEFDPAETSGIALGDTTGLGSDNFVLDISRVAVGDTFTIFISAVPAPATLALFGLGFIGLAAARRR